MEIQYAGLIGLYGGLLFGLSGWYFGRKKAKKERGIDEMYYHITKTARSFSWFATIGANYILFTLYAVGVPLSIPMVLGLLMLVQIGTWGIAAPVMHYLYSTGHLINTNIMVAILLLILSPILFAIVAVITQNWLFLLWPLPFVFIGMKFLKQGKLESEDEG